jgi:hypothetical protein
MNALLYFENGVYEILLRRTEEQDHNNLFKVKILLHPNVKQDCKSAPPKCEALLRNMRILLPQLREQDCN